MLKNSTVTVLGMLLSIFSLGQTEHLIVSKYIHLPGDSMQRVQLITSIDQFLIQASGSNKENSFVLKDDLPETSALLDEIKGMGNSTESEKKYFYKCYLTNVVPLDSINYLIQFSYIGSNDSMPILRASFKLVAKKAGDRYLFSSTLKRNTISWRFKNDADFIFYYNGSFNSGKANDYVKKAKEFDKKLHAPEYTTRIYLCDNLSEALDLLGVQYKSDYNGISHDNFSSFENNISLNLIGSNDSDPAFLDIHDLWHDRLHHVVSNNVLNRPVDESCAYLYGGSWGISWPEIFKRFKVYMGTNKDWLTAFNENKNFGTNQQYHLYVQYVIGALIVQQIEKEKGFGSVIELLSCGKRENGNENYFQALNKIEGINKSNFNEQVEKLVELELVK